MTEENTAKGSTDATANRGDSQDRLVKLSEQIADNTPGVSRVEPSLQRLIAELGASVAERLGLSDSARSKLKTGGIRVTLSGETAAVSIDIATEKNSPAVNVAQLLQGRIAQAIHREGFECGKIDINILSVES